MPWPAQRAISFSRGLRPDVAPREIVLRLQQLDHRAEGFVHDGHELLKQFGMAPVEAAGDAVKAVIGCRRNARCRRTAWAAVFLSPAGGSTPRYSAEGVRPRVLLLEQLGFTRGEPAAQDGGIDAARAVVYALEVARRIVDRHDVVEGTPPAFRWPCPLQSAPWGKIGRILRRVHSLNASTVVMSIGFKHGGVDQPCFHLCLEAGIRLVFRPAPAGAGRSAAHSSTARPRGTMWAMKTMVAAPFSC